MEKSPSVTQDKLQIGIVHLEGYPCTGVEELCSELKKYEIETAFATRPNVTFAMPEWFFPTAVVVYIVQPYFTAFLQEMAKDHYNALKEQLKKFSKRYIGKDVPELVAIGSKGKLSAKNEYSLAFSILVQLSPSLKVKLMLQKGLSEDEVTEAVNAFMDKILDISSTEIEGKVLGNTVFVSYDRVQKKAIILDPLNRK